MDIITDFENIRADLFGLQALAVLFTDSFATSTDEQTLLMNISTRKNVFVNSAWLLCDLIDKISKGMDEAIRAGAQKEKVLNALAKAGVRGHV